jgi:hypothetical protein
MPEILTRSVITEKVPKKLKVSVFGHSSEDLLKELEVYSPESMIGCKIGCVWGGHCYEVWVNTFGENAVHGKISQADRLFFYGDY